MQREISTVMIISINGLRLRLEVGYEKCCICEFQEVVLLSKQIILLDICIDISIDILICLIEGMYPNDPSQYHPYAYPNNPIEMAPSVPNHNELTTNGVCKKFIHGKCRLAENCPHPHDKSKIKPCNKFESMGQCGYGDKCNFSHDLKICPEFIKDKCEKGEHCSYRHVYKSCPNFDMGFCFNGKTCKYKHIVRKLCWDYMYGFCEKGSKCPDYHPKIFIDEDFKGTEELFKQLSKEKPQYYVCNYCAQIGHKVNKCPKRVEIQPKDVFKCGLCGCVHSYADDCNYKG